MFPQFDLFGMQIYTFGLSMSIAFILFFGMLYKLSIKFGINSNFFLNSVFFYFISIFTFSRLFYILSEWRDFKFIFKEGYLKFFLMSDYNVSLIGGIFGFLLVLYFKLKKFKLKSDKYIDAVVLSFFFAAIIGYIGAFLGGQILGKPTSLGIGIIYDNPFNKSPYSGPIFPLAIFYSIFCFLLFVGLYIARIFVKIEGFIGYLGILIFCSLLLIFEFFNGSPDIFSSYVYINLTQIGAILLLLYATRGMSKIYRQESKI